MVLDKLLDIEIKSDEMYKQVIHDYYDCDSILIMQENIDNGFGDIEFELTVANMRMYKEIELKERYGIDVPIELFQLSLADKINIYEGGLTV